MGVSWQRISKAKTILCAVLIAKQPIETTNSARRQSQTESVTDREIGDWAAELKGTLKLNKSESTC